MPEVPDPFETTEGGLNFFKKHGPWATVAVIVGFLFIGLIAVVAIGFWQGKLQFIPSITPTPTPHTPQQPPSEKPSQPNQESPEGAVRGDTSFKWGTPKNNSVALFDQIDGYFCPDEGKQYTSPDLFQDQPVHVSFGHLKTKVMLRSDIEGEPPTFIVSLGRDKKIFRLHVAEIEPQRVGFEHFDAAKSAADPTDPLKRVDPKDLDDPIPNNGILEIDMYSSTRNGNIVDYRFDFTYVRPDGNTRTDTLNYSVKLDDPSPEDTITEIGTGTLKGRCFKFLAN